MVRQIEPEIVTVRTPEQMLEPLIVLKRREGLVWGTWRESDDRFAQNNVINCYYFNEAETLKHWTVVEVSVDTYGERRRYEFTDEEMKTYIRIKLSLSNESYGWYVRTGEGIVGDSWCIGCYGEDLREGDEEDEEAVTTVIYNVDDTQRGGSAPESLSWHSG